MVRIATLVATTLLITSGTFAADWITAPSYYTHDSMSGERVRQYSPIGPFYTYPRGDFTRSGFRHTRSSIQVGGSADHYHLTEEWGKPILPYGEWRFPYRPYSVPYDAWGPPFWGRGFYRAPFGRFGGGFGGHPGYANPGMGGNQPPANPNLPGIQPGQRIEHHGYSPQQQLLDGRYPPFDQLGPFERKQRFDHFYPPRAAPAPTP